MKCIHGISVRKPCAKCREEGAKPMPAGPTWKVPAQTQANSQEAE